MRQRRGWEGHGGGCPRGATTPARLAMATVEEKRRFTLTKAQLDRRWGGEGRGDHGEATDKLGNTFSRWRVCTTTATLGREWRTVVDTTLRAVEARERQWSGERVRAGAGLLLELRRATWRLWQRMSATRRTASASVGHGDTDHFLKRCDSVFDDYD